MLEPLGADVEGRRLLLPDGGPPGRIETALPAYGELQRRLVPHAERMIGLGVPDMRPAQMPERLDEALEATGGDARVAALRGDFADWCAELAAAPGEASLDHNDLHAGNVLDGDRFYDWGDAVVAHPFASMLVPLAAAGDDAVRLRDAYLEAFSDLAPHAELVHTLELACRVGKVARALTWQRAVAHDPDASPDFAAAPRASLAAVLEPSYVAGF